MTPLCVLDLAPIVQCGDAGRALRNTLDLAQHCERSGYQRYCGLAEFIALTGADEISVGSHIFEHRARLPSFEIAATAHAR